MGDLRAQVAAVNRRDAFPRNDRKYGSQGYWRLRGDHGPERGLARGACGNSDGVYEAELFMDDDGVAVGARSDPRRSSVRRPDDDRSHRGLGPGQGLLQLRRDGGALCCQVAFKCLTSPLELPINDGQFRAIDLCCRRARVVSAVRPSAMRMWMTYPMTIVDTIFKALAPAVPDRVIAGHHADLVIARSTAGGRATTTSSSISAGLIGGGWGAKHDGDGMCATVAINDGDTHNGPTEQVEAKFPLLVERYALRQDFGGAGISRRPGTEQVVQGAPRNPLQCPDRPGQDAGPGASMAGSRAWQRRRDPPFRQDEHRFDRARR